MFKCNVGMYRTILFYCPLYMVIFFFPSLLNHLTAHLQFLLYDRDVFINANVSIQIMRYRVLWVFHYNYCYFERHGMILNTSIFKTWGIDVTGRAAWREKRQIWSCSWRIILRTKFIVAEVVTFSTTTVYYPDWWFALKPSVVFWL